MAEPISMRSAVRSRTKVMAVKHLQPIESPQDSHRESVKGLISEQESASTWFQAILSLIALVGFVGLGGVTYFTWLSIENEHVFLSGMKAALGIIGSFISVISLCCSSNSPGLGIFTGFYLLLILLPVIAVNGVMLAFYKTDNSAYFTAISEDQDHWEEKYGDMTMEEAVENANQMSYLCGMAGIAMAGLVSLMTLSFASLANATQTMREFVEVMCLSVSGISLALGMRALLLLNLFDDKQLVESVDRNNALFLLFIAAATIVLCIFVVMMIARSYSGKVIFSSLIIFILACGACYLGWLNLDGAALYDPQTKEDGTVVDSFICSDVLGRTSEEWLAHMGCFNKFSPIEECPDRAHLVANWDGEGDACMNETCCALLRYDVKNSFIVTGVMAFTLGAMATLMLLMACYLKSDLDGYNRDDNKCDVLVIIMIILMTLGAGGVGMFVFMIAGGVPFPGDAEMTGSMIDAGLVDSHLVTPTDLCMASFFEVILFPKPSCDRCHNVLYVNITASNAILVMDEHSPNIQNKTDTYISFQTESEEEAGRLMSSVQFCSKCMLEDGEATIKANIVEFKEEIQVDFDEDDVEANEDIVGEDAEVYETLTVIHGEQLLIDQKIPIRSGYNGMDQKITGIVLDEAGGLNGVQVTGQVPGCDKEYKTKTNKNGEFLLTLPAKPDFSPYIASLTYELPSYQTLITTAQIGGLPLIKTKAVPNVQMSLSGGSGPLKLNIFGSKNNHELSPKIHLTNQDGNELATFSSLPVGLYDLVLSKRGYFTNHRQVNVVSGQDNIYDLSVHSKHIGSNEIAVTMTWEDEQLDLDLHVMFKANKTDSCHVFFNHKQCGGAKLEGFSIEGGNDGGESIILKTGPSYYVFYVKASTESKGTLPLAQSKAHIDIYSSSGEEQIVSLDVPIGNLQADQWNAFCFNGKAGPASIVPLYWMSTEDSVDLVTLCEHIYGPLHFHNKAQESQGNEVVYDFKAPQVKG